MKWWTYLSDCTHPSGVVQDVGVRPAIVRRVGVWIVAQSGQHWCDDSHVPHHVSWDLPHPLGQGLHIDWLDDLVCGPLHPNRTEKNVGLTCDLKQWVKITQSHGHKFFLFAEAYMFETAIILGFNPKWVNLASSGFTYSKPCTQTFFLSHDKMHHSINIWQNSGRCVSNVIEPLHVFECTVFLLFDAHTKTPVTHKPGQTVATHLTLFSTRS